MLLHVQNVYFVYNVLGNRTRFSYTAESLLEKLTYGNGASQSLSYDLAGNVTAKTDAEGHAKQYLYDKVNRLTGVIDQLGNKTAYAYDPLDNIAKVTDALRHMTSYTYDKQGNLLTETDALGNAVGFFALCSEVLRFCPVYRILAIRPNSWPVRRLRSLQAIRLG